MREFYWEEKGIYYRVNDFKPDRITLVFVHGIGGSSSAWWPYEKIFENEYNVVSYDIRGHGDSKKYINYEDYEIKNFVNDLRDLISYLDLPKFILISNSFGGIIALEYLKSWKNTVAGNIFTSPEVYLNKGIPAKILRPTLGIIIWLFKFLPFNQKPRGHVNYSKYIGATDWDIGRNWADMTNTTFRVHFMCLKQSFTPKQEYGLEKIYIPTLVMHGEEDTMVPIKNAIALARGIKGAQFISIPGVDHNTAHNAVGIMSKAIESFAEKNKSKLLPS